MLDGIYYYARGFPSWSNFCLPLTALLLGIAHLFSRHYYVTAIRRVVMSFPRLVCYRERLYIPAASTHTTASFETVSSLLDSPIFNDIEFQGANRVLFSRIIYVGYIT
jgi:hypothetical protein